VRPANTTLVVAALLNPAWRVEIEVEALAGVRVREER
jgi:enamine deaminase RidA (YjgF/YER057c/UK114 family)